MLKAVTLRSTLIALSCALSFTARALADAPPHAVQVPPGDLTTALETLAKQSGVELVYQSDQVKGMRSQGVSGTLSAEQAVRKLLEGTPLILRTDSSGAMVIALPKTPAVPKASSTSQEGATPQASVAPEDRTGFWSRFRLAQAASSPFNAEDVRRADEERAENTQNQNKTAEASAEPSERKVEEVVVTGSRLRGVSGEGPVPVNVYSRERIERSGQTTVAGFLNTLPEVGNAFTESLLNNANANQGYAGNTTVQLRGLPAGTTAILLNGRRLETVGSSTSSFNLNFIPVAAIERIEIVPQGSSAIYGSSALAGVVNIILKKDLQGLQLDAGYGSASGTDEQSASLAWGNIWQRASLSVIGTYYERGALEGTERDITADRDYRRFGGPDLRSTQCRTGNVYSATPGSNLAGLSSDRAAIPAGLTGAPTLQDFAATAGQLNLCSPEAYRDQLPQTHRVGVLVTGSLSLTPTAELFTELMYSRIRQISRQQFQRQSRARLAAANPFNPFGEDVLIDYRYDDSVARTGFNEDGDFAQAVVGARGRIGAAWDWSLTAWRSKDDSRDRFEHTLSDPVAINGALASADPATAFNPFTGDAPLSTELLAAFYPTVHYHLVGEATTVAALVRGPLVTLPAGEVQSAFGAEVRRDRFTRSADLASFNAIDDLTRSRAVYAEVRVPLAARGNGADRIEALAMTAALRYDDFSSFGGKFTPQGGLEWRPAPTVLVRAAYSQAYQAPASSQLRGRVYNFSGLFGVLDPRRGGETVFPQSLCCGNPDLEAETGHAYSLGAVWESTAPSRPRIALTGWSISQVNRPALLQPQVIIDHEELFPGRVVRGPGEGDLPGPIQSVDYRYINFGRLDVKGIDFDFRNRMVTRIGTFEPSLRVTNTLRYDAAITPGAPTTDRVSRAVADGWAPRWKGSLGLNWSRPRYSVGVIGRYVSSYVDYDGIRSLGNFWLLDVNARVQLGQALGMQDNALWSGSSLSFGASNLLNSLPKFSNLASGTPAGYDPTQYDIRGRFVYANLSFRW